MTLLQDRQVHKALKALQAREALRGQQAPKEIPGIQGQEVLSANGGRPDLRVPAQRE